MVPAESQAIINKASIGSSTEVNQSSVEGIIANQTPFRAEGFQHSLCSILFMNGRRSRKTHFILDAVTHRQLEFDWVPEALICATRPYHS